MVNTMQSLSDKERREVLGEVLVDELKAIREYVQDIPQMKQELTAMNERLERVEFRMSIVEAIVRDDEY